MRTFAFLLLFVASVASAFQSSQVERFDTSGVPRRPTTFVEQQIFEMLGYHRPGDLVDAMRIQQRLGRYYADKGDSVRSVAAFLLAAEAEKLASGDSPSTRTTQPVGVGVDQQLPSRSEFWGNYYGYEGRLLHTWEFHPDGTFLHTWISSGTGTNVRNSERGVFQFQGDKLMLRISSTAGGFATPGVGGRSTLSGGAADATASRREVKIQVLNSGGIVLDGIQLKPKNW